MKTIKTLIVDDSVVYRSQLRAALGAVPAIEVVGASSNGELALERLAQVDVDLMILDLEMPGLDGVQTLRAAKERGHPCKVLMFSSASAHSARKTMEAFRLGVDDFVAKPGTEPLAPTDTAVPPGEKIRLLLEPKIRALFAGSFTADAPSAPPPTANVSYPPVIWELFQPQIVVIGSSTGGPTVLERIFSEITPPFLCPIVIAQHMPPLFTAALAERLSRNEGVVAAEARHGEKLEKNRVYVAPGDFHLRLKKQAGQVCIDLERDPPQHSVRPAVDPLFLSAAEIFRDRCLGIVLTGMGMDGASGAQAIKEKNGAVLIQNEKTCVVYGMPGAVAQAGAFDRSLPPAGIIDALKEKVSALPSAGSRAGGSR